MLDVIQWLTLVAAAAAGGGAIASAIVSWRIHKANASPEVVAYIDRHDTAVLWFVLQNIGNGVAYDIEFDTGNLPVGPQWVKTKFRAFQAFGVPMLMPGQVRMTPIYELKSENAPAPETYEVIVKWAGEHDGDKQEAAYQLDYETFRTTLWTDANETLMRRSLQNIDQTLKSEAETLRLKRTMPDGTRAAIERCADALDELVELSGGRGVGVAESPAPASDDAEDEA